jgi:hypothetical protein
MPSLRGLQPYLNELLEDREVRGHLATAATNLSEAGARAAKAGSRRKAAKDPHLRERLIDGGRAAVTAAIAARGAAERERRRQQRRRRTTAAVAGLVAAGVVVGGAAARSRSGAGEDIGSDSQPPT